MIVSPAAPPYMMPDRRNPRPQHLVSGREQKLDMKNEMLKPRYRREEQILRMISIFVKYLISE
jgi:hypothetical protein